MENKKIPTINVATVILGLAMVGWGLIFVIGAFSSLWVFLFFIYGILMFGGGIRVIKQKKFLGIIIGVIALIISVLLSLFLINKKDEGDIKVEDTPYAVELPYLIKFAALIEREECYRTWIDEIITPGITKDEDKIKRIFDWIKDFPTVTELKDLGGKLPTSYEFKNIVQHEYQVLIKQYGGVGEKALNFCNLITIAGYTASPVYHINPQIVIVRSGNNNFLYFDFKKRRLLKPEEIPSDHRTKAESNLKEKDNNSKQLFSKAYLHGYAQIAMHRFRYVLLEELAKKKKVVKPEPVQYLLEENIPSSLE